MDTRAALSIERTSREMSQKQLLTFTEAARRISDSGLPTTARCISGWAEREPDLVIKIAGRCAIRADAVSMILAGVPLSIVAEKMRAIKSAVIAATSSQPESPAADSPAGRFLARRQSTGSRGPRRRG